MKLVTFLLAMLAVSLPSTSNAMSNWDNVKEELIESSISTGYDLNSLVSIAYVESSFRSGVKNKLSTATGLMQITKPTAKYLLSKYGPDVGLSVDADLKDTRVSSLMGAFYLKEVKHIMEKRLGREINMTENYLGYKFSPYRATHMLQAKASTSLLSFYPDAAKRNPRVYYINGKERTIGDTIKMFERRLSKASKTYFPEANYLAQIVKSVHFDKVKALFNYEHHDCNMLAYKGSPLKREMSRLLYSQLGLEATGACKNRVISDVVGYELSIASGRSYNGFMV